MLFSVKLVDGEDAWIFATTDAKLDGGVIASILRHKIQVNVHKIGGKLELKTKKSAFLRRKSECAKFESVRI